MLSNIWLKRKAILASLALPLIVALVAIAAYGLGRLSALEEGKDRLIIHPPPQSSGETSPLRVQ